MFAFENSENSGIYYVQPLQKDTSVKRRFLRNKILRKPSGKFGKFDGIFPAIIPDWLLDNIKWKIGKIQLG